MARKEDWRQQYSLVPRQPGSSGRRENSLPHDSRFTSEQTQQLVTTTRRYLRDNNVDPDYENFTKAQPVIRALVDESILTIRERQPLEIMPYDNLSELFAGPYARRKQFLTAAKAEVEGLDSSSAFVGPLALPGHIVRGARAEIANAVFTPKLTKTHDYIEESSKRRGIYTDVVSAARGEVEKLIPGSTTVSLNPGQEAGLVRNFVFGWLVFGQARPLIETEEIVANRDVFIALTREEVGDRLYDFCRMVGIDYRASSAYLLNLYEQMQAMIGSTPNVSDLQSLGSVYKALSNDFLLVNPFQKIEELSFSPKDQGKSIWDPGRAITVDIHGKAHRVPLPATLRVAAMRASVTDGRRASDLTNASENVDRLFEEIQGQQDMTKLLRMQQEGAVLEERARVIEETLLQGNIPLEGVYSQEDLQEFVNDQIAHMDDEQKVLPFLKNYIAERQQQAFSLLEKYQYVSKVDPRDIPLAQQLYYEPTHILRQARHFLNDRIIQRIENLEYVHAARVDERRSRARYFEQAAQTTVFDIFAIRNQLWLADALGNPFVGTTPRDVWRVFLTAEQRVIDNRLYDIARERLFPGEKRGLGGHKYREIRLYLKENKASLIDESNDLRQRSSQIENWQEQIAVLDVPSLLEVPKHFVLEWKRNRDRDLQRAIEQWTEGVYIAQAMQRPFDLEKARRHIQGKGKREMDSDELKATAEVVSRLLQSPKGVQQIALRTLLYVPPEELLLNETITFAEVIGKYRYPRDSSSMWHPQPRSRSEQRNDGIRNAFQSALKARGYQIDDALYAKVLNAGEVDKLQRNVIMLSTLKHIEPEITHWLQDVRARLDVQAAESPTALVQSPEKIIQQANNAAQVQRKKIRTYKAQRYEAVNKRVRQLAHLGLILPEETFEAL